MVCIFDCVACFSVNSLMEVHLSIFCCVFVLISSCSWNLMVENICVLGLKCTVFF